MATDNNFDYQHQVTLINHLQRLALIAFQRKDEVRFNFLQGKISLAKSKLSKIMNRSVDK
jgi:hypothetical protein